MKLASFLALTLAALWGGAACAGRATPTPAPLVRPHASRGGCDLGETARCVDACARGRAESCTALGVAYENGDVLARDVELAASLFERGCDGGDPRACTELGVLYA